MGLKGRWGWEDRIWLEGRGKAMKEGSGLGCSFRMVGMCSGLRMGFSICFFVCWFL